MFKSLCITIFATFYLAAHDVTFTKQTMPFGIECRQLCIAIEDNKAQPIGSVVILSNAQLRTFDLPAHAAINKTAFPPEIIELFDIISSIKNELAPKLEQVIMVGDLYVKPEFRNQGYGKLLMDHVCQEIFDTTDTRYIVITIEPFEYENHIQKTLRDAPDFAHKRDQLITLYTRCGFTLHADFPLYMYKERQA